MRIHRLKMLVAFQFPMQIKLARNLARLEIQLARKVDTAVMQFI
jgi:hypothetical protein